ncbi:MAG TPA: hypothetical protein VF855_06965 [Acidimicrobiales bacterium]
MLILLIIVFGMACGWVAQLILGRRGSQIDWTFALVAGLAGSFLGGLVFSLVAGDGLKIRASGIIGSILGALVITGVWQAVQAKRGRAAKATTNARARSGNPAKRAGG